MQISFPPMQATSNNLGTDSSACLPTECGHDDKPFSFEDMVAQQDADEAPNVEAEQDVTSPDTSTPTEKTADLVEGAEPDTASLLPAALQTEPQPEQPEEATVAATPPSAILRAPNSHLITAPISADVPHPERLTATTKVAGGELPLPAGSAPTPKPTLEFVHATPRPATIGIDESQAATSVPLTARAHRISDTPQSNIAPPRSEPAGEIPNAVPPKQLTSGALLMPVEPEKRAEGQSQQPTLPSSVELMPPNKPIAPTQEAATLPVRPAPLIPRENPAHTTAPLETPPQVAAAPKEALQTPLTPAVAPQTGRSIDPVFVHRATLPEPIDTQAPAQNRAITNPDHMKPLSMPKADSLEPKDQAIFSSNRDGTRADDQPSVRMRTQAKPLTLDSNAPILDTKAAPLVAKPFIRDSKAPTLDKPTLASHTAAMPISSPPPMVTPGMAQVSKPSVGQPIEWVEETSFSSEIRSTGPETTLRPQQLHNLMQRPGLPHQISQQLVEAIRMGGPGKPVELHLNPAELGRVTLSLNTGADGAITVSVLADRPETLDLMRRHAEILARDFAEIGYHSTEFSFGQQNAGHSDDSDHDQTQSSSSHHGAVHDDPPLPQPATVLNLASDRVDIRL